MSLIEKLLEKQAQKSETETQKSPTQSPSDPSQSSADHPTHPPTGFSPETLFDKASDNSQAPQTPSQTTESFELPGLSDDDLARFSEPSTETAVGQSKDDINWDQSAELFEKHEVEDDNEFDNTLSASPSPLGNDPDGPNDPDNTYQANDDSDDDILALFQANPVIDEADSATPSSNQLNDLTTHPPSSGLPEDTKLESKPEADLLFSTDEIETPHREAQAGDFSDAALDALIASNSSGKTPESKTAESKTAESLPPALHSSTAAPATTAAKAPLKSIHIDLERLDEGGIITPNGTNNKISEEYRLIKRPLLLNILGEGDAQMDHPNLIMVTSSIPGEGKTFSSVNLAMSLAMELDRTVLLVDADVAKPSFSRVFDIEVEMGLIDILLGDATLEDTLLKTNIPKLTILPAGRRHQNSVELLGSEHMRSLTSELATRYEDRIIVFDTPPLLATTEAGVLAGLMSQIVVVVEANQTPHFVLRESLSQLDPSKYISLLLNKTQKNSGSGYYYYYDYNYKDSYYYGYE